MRHRGKIALHPGDSEAKQRLVSSPTYLVMGACWYHANDMGTGIHAIPGQGESSDRQSQAAPAEPDAVSLLRQLLAEERARSDQLLEAVTAWQLRARQAEERLVAMMGAAREAAPASAAPASAPPAAAAGRARSDTAASPTAAMPPAAPSPAMPAGDPVFKRHPLYRGKRFQQVVNDFVEEARAAQRQYASLASRPGRTRKDEIALGLLDAEWAPIGGAEWHAADPRWLAQERARFEYRLELGRTRNTSSILQMGLVRIGAIILACIALITIILALIGVI